MTDTQLHLSENLQKYSQTLQIGHHTLMADLPAERGGQDLGPAPSDFILAGLAACTSMTLRMYAQRKAWPLESIDIDLQWVKSETSSTNAGNSPVRPHIERTIQLRGPLSTEQQLRLREIADRCPIQKALTTGFNITNTDNSGV